MPDERKLFEGTTSRVDSNKFPADICQMPRNYTLPVDWANENGIPF